MAVTTTAANGQFLSVAGGTITGALTVTGSVLFSAATAAAPSVAIGTSNKGFFASGANAIGLALNGAANVDFQVNFLQLGTSGTADYQIYRDGNSGSLTVSGTYNAGMQIKLYSSSHATKAGDFEFISATAMCGGFDNSADAWTFSTNTAVGAGALATGATTGHFYIPTSAGVPTGVPAGSTGRVALQFDTTNNKLYVYDGAWIATAALT